MSEACPHESWVTVDAQRVYRVACRGCVWTHLVASDAAPPVRRCPWCGSQDITAEMVGAFASFACPVHGRVTWVTDEEIWLDEGEARMEVDLCCPHCAPPGPTGDR